MKIIENKFHLISVCFCLLFSVAALAVDSDGDGVPDNIDAFPNNPEATTDTDHDGMPDVINYNKLPTIFADSFESGNFTAGGWTLGGTMTGTPWSIYSYGGSNGYVAKLTQLSACGFLQTCKTAYIQKTVTAPAGGADVHFSLKGNVGFDWGPAEFYIDGVLSQQWTSLSNWTAVSKTLLAGTHVLKWQTSQGLGGGYVYIDSVLVSEKSSLVEDTDDDNDGVLDTADKFPLDPTESSDNDNDGIGDNADTDDDNDGVLDISDNCPLVANPDQLNNDGDSLGDACDADDDNDGVVDSLDACPFDGTASVGNNDYDLLCNLNDPDDDNDGVADALDAFPLNWQASVDSDHDGLPDSVQPFGFESGTFADLPLLLSGSAPWDIVSTNKHTGNYAAHAGSGVTNGYAMMEMTAVTGATVSFWFSDSGCCSNVLTFWMDGVQVASWNQNDVWQQYTKAVTPGSHVLKWQYAKYDASGEVWIDDISTLVADTDDDNDGVLDVDDAFPLDAAESVDTDGDGIGNNADWDDDNDGVPDTVDAAPLNAADTTEITLPLDGVYKGSIFYGSQTAQ